MNIFSFFKSRRSLEATITELRGKVATLSLDNKQLEADIELVSSQLDDSQRDLERTETKWRNDGLHEVEIMHALRMALKFIDVWSDEEWAEKIEAHPLLLRGKTLKANLMRELSMYLLRELDVKPGLVDLEVALKRAGFDKSVPGDTRCRFVASIRAEQAIVAKFEDYDPSNPFDMFDYLSYLDIKKPDWRSGKPRIEIVDRVEAMKTAGAMRWKALDYLGVSIEKIDNDWGYDWMASDYCYAVSKAGNDGLFVQHPTYAAELRKNYYAVAAALLEAEIDHLMQAHGVAA